MLETSKKSLYCIDFIVFRKRITTFFGVKVFGNSKLSWVLKKQVCPGNVGMLCTQHELCELCELHDTSCIDTVEVA